MIGVLEFSALVFLPGAWVACGLPVCSLPFSAKVCIGALLSPLFLIVEFYVLRLLGVPFEVTPHLLVLLNLPALVLVARRIGRLRMLTDWRMIAAWGVVLGVPLACLAPTVLDPQTRIYTGHAWMYSDPIYGLARGDLVPEDPEVAGLRLAYPWGGLLYQGLLSFVLNSPPAASYIWTNVVALALTAGLCAALVGELGGGRLTRISSVVWLLFGLNFVGYSLELIARHVAPDMPYIFGDYRYSPWYLKYYFFQQEPIALGILLAIVYVSIRRWPGGLGLTPLLLLGVLMCDLAIFYPILMPAAGALVAVQLAYLLFIRFRARIAVPSRELVGLGLVLTVAALLTLLHTRFVTADVTAPTIRLAPLSFALRKAITGPLVLSPLLVGALIVARSGAPALRGPVVVLGLAALGSYVLYVAFQLPGFAAEYKFILTAAVCLAPLASLALDGVWRRLAGRALPVLAVLTLVLAVPLVRTVRQDWPWFPAQGLERTPPQVDLNGFDLRLASSEPMAGLVDVIRQQTPVDTLVIAARADLHLPTLTARSMYSPPAQALPHPGVNIKSESLLHEAKGYSNALLDLRAANLDALFTSDEPAARQRSLDDMQSLGRPLAIILNDAHDAGLFEWLSDSGDGRLIYEGAGYRLWYVDALA
jgi:hypothetical protein